MSQPTGPTEPEVPDVVRGTRHELRRQGRAFGLDYDLDVRITTLSDPEEETAGPTSLPEARRLALPAAAEPREAPQPPAPEGIGRWESEGGR